MSTTLEARCAAQCSAIKIGYGQLLDLVKETVGRETAHNNDLVRKWWYWKSVRGI